MSALLLTVALMPLGAADDTPVWLQTGRITVLNDEPVKDASCTVPVDELCGRVRADFGSRVAVHEDTLVVSEVREETIHIYEQDFLGWTPTATFSGPAGFGRAIAAGDDVVVVGAMDASEVHVFERSKTGWALADVLDVSGSICFGFKVDLDDTRLLVRDPCASSLHVFDQEPQGWTLTTSLVVPGVFLLGLGGGISGDTVLASSLFQGIYEFREGPSGWSSDQVTTDSPWMMEFSGNHAAYPLGGGIKILERSPAGWETASEVFPEDASAFEGQDGFAGNLALSGQTLVVGAPQDDPSPGVPSVPDSVEDQCVSQFGYGVCVPPRPGAAYVFEEIGDEWVQTAKLTGDLVGDQEFGDTVAISDGGEKIAVGAPRKLVEAFGSHLDVNPENSVHVFERLGAELV